VVVAAFVAATIVSIASLLNSASTLITMDVVRHFKPNLSDARIVRIGRISTAVLLCVAMAWAPQLQLFPSLWQYLQAVLAYAVPPVVTLFVVGRIWRGATAHGAAATLLIGSMCGAGLFMCNGVLRITHLHFLYAAPLLTAIDTVILIGASLVSSEYLSAAQAAAMAPPTAEKSAIPPRFWQDYRWQALALVFITAGVVYAFR
jgi:SSS family solute:Na+ symporter